ncbi:hypothetical protein [Parafrankia sp. FMc2]|uniref:hypothetical protein n=1 Tax=Parafrankia sp. FMc2 TaxID=3233196 RepID=UPI0034D57A89
MVDVGAATKDQPLPPASHLVISGTILAVAAVLPVAVRVLPVLALLVTLVLLIRPGRVLRPARRRRRPARVTRLRAHVFSVRLTDGAGQAGAVLACRLLTRSEPSVPPPLVGGEYVEGQGRSRSGSRVVEVHELVVDASVTYHAARLRSPIPLVAASGAMILAAVVLVAVRRERLQDLANDQVIPSIAAVVVPVFLFFVLKLYRRSRRRRRS